MRPTGGVDGQFQPSDFTPECLIVTSLQERQWENLPLLLRNPLYLYIRERKDVLQHHEDI